MDISVNAANKGIYGKKALYDVREISTIRDMFDSSTKLFAQRTAFWVKDKFGAPYRAITYEKLKNDVYALGTAFMNIGLAGKKIAVIGENRYEWAITYLSVVCGAGIIVPLDKELPPEEIKYLVETAEVSAIVYSDRISEKVEKVVAESGILKIKMDEIGNYDHSLKNLISIGASLIQKGDHSFSEEEIRAEDVDIILFTSGTTGLAKGVMLSHKNIAANLMNMCPMINIEKEDIFFSILPIHHTYECTCGFLCPIYRGSSIAFCEGLKYIAQNMQEAKVTLFLGVPLIFESMYNALWKTIQKNGLEKKLKTIIKISNILRKIGIDLRKKLFKKIHKNFGGNIKMFIAGAAALDPEIAKGFDDIGIRVIQGYGLTECAPIAAVNRDIYSDDAAGGLPLPNVQIKIADPDEDGIGEILIKGDNVMVGYYKNQQATDEVIKDGWLHTGDLGHFDDRRFLFITGRKKNVIITANGKNVFPEEVETYLCRNAYIQECMVYGKQKDKDVIISVQVMPNYEAVEVALGEDYTQDALRELINEQIREVNKQMPLYKRVESFEIRQEEFNKTTTKKIKRFANSY